MDSRFETALSDPWFRSCVSDVIEFGLSRNEAAFAETYKDTDFVLNQKYTREDVCRLLRWAKEPNYQNVGGYFHDKETNTFPVFINYEKDPDISVTVIENGKAVKKEKPQPPKRLVNIVRCKNPRCISSIEEECDQIFELSSNGKYRCIYCEQELQVKPE